MSNSEYNYEADMLNAALKLKTHCNIQHRYKHGCQDCCFRNRENDDLIKECPLSAARPELWDVSDEQTTDSPDPDEINR